MGLIVTVILNKCDSAERCLPNPCNFIRCSTHGVDCPNQAPPPPPPPPPQPPMIQQPAFCCPIHYNIRPVDFCAQQSF